MMDIANVDFCFSGARGSGKTTALVKFVQDWLDADPERVACIYTSFNPGYLNRMMPTRYRRRVRLETMHQVSHHRGMDKYGVFCDDIDMWPSETWRTLQRLAHVVACSYTVNDGFFERYCSEAEIARARREVESWVKE